MKAQKSTVEVSLRQFKQLFSATPRGARLARRLVVHQLQEWGFPYGSAVSGDVAAVTAELAANAVTHGRVRGRDFHVRLTEDGGVLRIEVADARGDRVPEIAEPGDEGGGRGLWIVAGLADKWGVSERDVGKTVWAELTGA